MITAWQPATDDRVLCWPIKRERENNDQQKVFVMSGKAKGPQLSSAEVLREVTREANGATRDAQQALQALRQAIGDAQNKIDRMAEITEQKIDAYGAQLALDTTNKLTNTLRVYSAEVNENLAAEREHFDQRVSELYAQLNAYAEKLLGVSVQDLLVAELIKKGKINFTRLIMAGFIAEEDARQVVEEWLNRTSDEQ